MINLNILPNLLIGRAGQRPRSGKPTMVAIHGQEGVGNPHSYFANVAADSTCWIARDGHVERYLLDSDIAWTEGDVTEPMAHNNPIVEGYLKAGVTNFNEICLSVEIEAWNSEASAAAHKQADGTPYPASFAHATPAQYQAVVALCVYWCKTWGIPADRNHIVKHADIGAHKGCPGSVIDVDQLAKDVAAQYAASSTPVPPKPFPPIIDPNPKHFAIGAGVLAELKRRGEIADTNEQYFSPNANQPGLMTRSMTWAHAPNGEVHIYVAYQQTPDVWQVKVYKEI